MNPAGTSSLVFGSGHTATLRTTQSIQLKVVRRKVDIIPEECKEFFLDQINKNSIGPIGYLKNNVYYRCNIAGYFLYDVGLTIVYEEYYLDEEEFGDLYRTGYYFNSKQTGIRVKETITIDKFLEKYFVDLL